MSDIIRVLRLIEYVGPRRVVEDEINRRSVKGYKSVTYVTGETMLMRESVLGTTNEILQCTEEEWENPPEDDKEET